MNVKVLTKININTNNFLIKIISIFKIYKYYRISKNKTFGLSNLAILYSLSENQTQDCIKYFSKRNYREKFPIESLRYKKSFIIQSKKYSQISSIDSEIILVPNPIIYIIVYKLMHQNIFYSFKKFISVIQSIKLSEKRLISQIILHSINSVKELDIFSTISSLKRYPDEFHFPKECRNFSTNVIHYSQNSVNINFQDENIVLPENSMIDSSSLGDIHWVWTQSYANYLMKFNNKIEFRAVGSITFKIMELNKISKIKNIVTIFDVAPHKILEGKSFYNFELSKNFFNDIINLRHQSNHLKNLHIQVKPKRQLDSKIHIQDYLNLLRNFENNCDINILPWDSNIYDVVFQSELVISIPFTSTAHIADELGIDSIYYYPFQRKISNPIFKNEIPLICGKENLVKYVKSKFKKI